MNEDVIKDYWSVILDEIGENSNRIGLKDTPKRIAKMYKEIFRGYDPKQKPKITTFPNGEDGVVYDQMIIDEGNFFSMCEHHGIPFYGQYYFAYIPDENGKILGLSKVARIVDYYSAKLQVQERLGQEIVDELMTALTQDGYVSPAGMALVMKAKHLCKSMRGCKKDGYMTTNVFVGAFRDNTKNARNEFLQIIGGKI